MLKVADPWPNKCKEQRETKEDDEMKKLIKKKTSLFKAFSCADGVSSFVKQEMVTAVKCSSCKLRQTKNQKQSFMQQDEKQRDFTWKWCKDGTNERKSNMRALKPEHWDKLQQKCLNKRSGRKKGDDPLLHHVSRIIVTAFQSQSGVPPAGP